MKKRVYEHSVRADVARPAESAAAPAADMRQLTEAGIVRVEHRRACAILDLKEAR